jgi:hypothetical protein
MAQSQRTTSSNAVKYAPPKCPACRWHLAIAAEDKSWVARCPNPSCSVGVAPPTVNEPLLAFVRERGSVVSADVAERFGWSYPNADNHLTRLLQVGLVKRCRVDPVKGGKRFAWSVA